MRFVHPRQVTLLAGPFRDAMLTDLAYLMMLDPDRLVAPFLREAGVATASPSYGGWESEGLDGHTAGHVLSALAWLSIASVGAEPRARLDHLVAEIRRAQTTIGTGYVGGVPGGAALFESLRHGGVRAATELGSSDRWVPWYNLHKTFSGLLYAVELLDHAQAAQVLLALAEWWLDIAQSISEQAFEVMLDTEFGGMNDAFARLSAWTGRSDFAAMALRFSHRALLDPLLDGDDRLTGLHANTQIAKAVGYASTAALTRDESLFAAADLFWHQVVDGRSVSIGGNSVREHFPAVNDSASVLEDREGPESCNTYNMLKLTKALAGWSAGPEYLDFVERAVFSHQLASQHPVRGGFVYFTPMRPRHYRVYSQAELDFWCCVGTGMEAQAKYGELIFATEDGALAVNLFISAVLDVPELGGRFRMETDFPADDLVTLRYELDAPRSLRLRLRVPGWSGGLAHVRVNGVDAPFSGEPGAIVIDRQWNPGDTVTFRVPMEPRVESLAGESGWRAYLVGPVVLASRNGAADLRGLEADGSRMGHVAAGRLRGFGDLAIVAPDEIPTPIGEQPSQPLRFRLATVDPVGEILLEPFSGIHDERYAIYFPVSDAAAGGVPGRRAELLAADRESLALDRVTVDAVAFGEQQPESDHGFRGTDSSVGRRGGIRWRWTRSSMSVVLRDPEAEGLTLRVGFEPGDTPTHVEIAVDGTRIAIEDVLPGIAPFDEIYELPRSAESERRVTFSAGGGAATPGVTTVRILRWAAP